MDRKSDGGDLAFAHRQTRVGEQQYDDNDGFERVEVIPVTRLQVIKDTKNKRFTSGMKGLDVERTPVTGFKTEGQGMAERWYWMS